VRIAVAIAVSLSIVGNARAQVPPDPPGDRERLPNIESGDEVELESGEELPAEDLEVEEEGEDPLAIEERPGEIRYLVESIEVEGNSTTQDYVVARFVSIEPGDVLDVEDPRIEAIRWRLLGTGYFDEVNLRLRRGSRRGWVALVIQVEERNTLLIDQIALGFSQGVSASEDSTAEVLPYAGLAIAETNFLGLGMELEVSVLGSTRQQGVRLRFNDPAFLGSDFLVGASAFLSNGLEFFGDDPLVAVECPPMTDPEDMCPPEVEARNAVVIYRRFGGSIGMGHDLGTSTSFSLDWYGEVVDVGVRPDAASEARGTEVDPIDFGIQPELSFVSTLRFGLQFDLRDDPGLTHEGVLTRFDAMLGSRIFGSDYSFLKLEGVFRWWLPLPGPRHHLRFTAFAGGIFGSAPFFHRFFASDLSDLIPSRILLMNIDDRPPPNLFDTSIAEMRSEDFGARLDVEYGLTFYRGEGFLRALEAYLNVGVYMLADTRDLTLAIPGYEGFSQLPIDLTFDIGIRLDTSIGAFQIGFSSLLGFIPVFSP
jgi:outer membrane protein insertion porin family